MVLRDASASKNTWALVHVAGRGWKAYIPYIQIPDTGMQTLYWCETICSNCKDTNGSKSECKPFQFGCTFMCMDEQWAWVCMGVHLNPRCESTWNLLQLRKLSKHAPHPAKPRWTYCRWARLWNGLGGNFWGIFLGAPWEEMVQRRRKRARKLELVLSCVKWQK